MQPANAERRALRGQGSVRGVLAGRALTGAAVCASLVMSAIALARSGSGGEMAASSRTPTGAAASVVDVKIEGEWKAGPDGKRHDAWTQTEFAVKAGKRVTLRIDNADSSPHSLTSPEAGVNIIALPGTHTYSLVVNRRGRFHWRCMLTCDTGSDGWAMTHAGYMSGYITAS